MNQPAKAQEPSMEEILASIRRIIADDDPANAPPKAADPLPPPPGPGPDAPQAATTVSPAAPETATQRAEIDAMLSQLNAAHRQPPPPPPEPPSAPDVLDLTEAMAAAASSPSPPPVDAAPGPQAFRTIDGQPDVVFEDQDSRAPAPAPRQESPDAGLISAATSAAVDSAFNTLAQTVLVQNGRTLEDLVREMLRPLLKTWLDDNLPGLVERLVRAEIERVSRGRP